MYSLGEMLLFSILLRDTVLCSSVREAVVKAW